MSCSDLTSKDVIYKHPNETANLGMEFAGWLNNGETISDPVVTSTPAGLSITNPTVLNSKIAITVAGGVSGYNYRIQVQVTTSSSEILIGEGILKVRDR